MHQVQPSIFALIAARHMIFCIIQISIEKMHARYAKSALIKKQTNTNVGWFKWQILKKLASNI